MPTHNPIVKKAHWTIANHTRSGRLPKPSTLKCTDCEKQATEYDHHNGHENVLDVQPVCASCHALRAWKRGERKLTPKMWFHPKVCEHGNSPIRNCVECKRRYVREYRERNLEKVRERGRESARKWRRAHGIPIGVGKSNIGRKHTAESRANMAASRLGSHRSEETKKRMSDARKAWWARKHEVSS